MSLDTISDKCVNVDGRDKEYYLARDVLLLRADFFDKMLVRSILKNYNVPNSEYLFVKGNKKGGWEGSEKGYVRAELVITVDFWKELFADHTKYATEKILKSMTKKRKMDVVEEPDCIEDFVALNDLPLMEDDPYDPDYVPPVGYLEYDCTSDSDSDDEYSDGDDELVHKKKMNITSAREHEDSENSDSEEVDNECDPIPVKKKILDAKYRLTYVKEMMAEERYGNNVVEVQNLFYNITI